MNAKNKEYLDTKFRDYLMELAEDSKTNAFNMCLDYALESGEYEWDDGGDLIKGSGIWWEPQEVVDEEVVNWIDDNYNDLLETSIGELL